MQILIVNQIQELRPQRCIKTEPADFVDIFIDKKTHYSHQSAPDSRTEVQIIESGTVMPTVRNH